MPTPHYGQPRYRVIADELRDRIESGTIPPGSLLPTENALTTEFGVSRGTIRQAIAALRDEGLVATEHGRGTYASTSYYQHRPDRKPKPQTRQREATADAELAELLNVRIGTALIVQERVTQTGTRDKTVIREYRLRPIQP